MSQDIKGLREQILANARFLLKTNANTIAQDNSSSTSKARDSLFSNTILAPSEQITSHAQVIVFGEGQRLRGVVMVGLKPAIEGGEAPTVEIALRKLLQAIAETSMLYIPKIGDHMRSIHGGGIFDEDLIASELREPQKEIQKRSLIYEDFTKLGISRSHG